jgi:heat shock protein HtpX
VLGSGYLPPIIGGFGRFMRSKTIAEGMASLVSESEADGTSHPYDTHPSLKERLDALARMPRGTGADLRPATVLFGRLGEWERRVLGTVLDQNWARGLKTVGWDEVIDRVYLPGWRKRVQEHATVLDGLRIGSLPLAPAELARRGALLAGTDKEAASETERATRMSGFLVTALALLLVEAGWRVEATPGEEFIVRRSDSEAVRFSELVALVTGERQLRLGLPDDLPLTACFN